MKHYLTFILSLSLAFVTQVSQAETGRWYNFDEISQGEVLFLQNCATCHGSNAEAMAGWEQAKGEKSAPPLDGTAHTWHHSLEQLSKTIQQGNVQIGGTMPAFKGEMSEQETSHIIAYFQSKWPDDIYQQWADRFKVVATQEKVVATQMVATKEDVTQLLKLRLGNNDIAPATETGIKGVYQTQFGDKYAYLIEGGRYVFIGDLIDLKLARNITEISRKETVKDTLAKVSLSNLIIFPAREQERTVLNVFTDTSCGYCQKLHTEIGYLQDAGISVHYFPFPRGGNRGPGYQDLKSVWCAANSNEAMDIAKGVSSGALPDGNCDRASFVDQGFELGRKLGISGTPALFSSNGTKFNGYVPHKELIPMLLNEL